MLAEKCRCMNWIIKEVIIIKFYYNMNRAGGFSLSRSQRPLTYTMKQQKKVCYKVSVHTSPSLGIPLHWPLIRAFIFKVPNKGLLF
jgi:hypothetical protein